MDENRVDEFLEHHGIKGQRWTNSLEHGDWKKHKYVFQESQQDFR